MLRIDVRQWLYTYIYQKENEFVLNGLIYIIQIKNQTIINMEVNQPNRYFFLQSNEQQLMMLIIYWESWLHKSTKKKKCKYWMVKMSANHFIPWQRLRNKFFYSTRSKQLYTWLSMHVYIWRKSKVVYTTSWRTSYLITTI